MHYGVVDARQRAGALRPTSRCPARACRTTWRSPSTTRSSTTARCSGTPSRSPRASTPRASIPTCRPASRSSRAAAAAPTSAGSRPHPTYVLHWINAYEDGDEIVLDGFFQERPAPAARRRDRQLLRAHVPLPRRSTRCRAAPHRWRFNLRTGATRRRMLSDRIIEFGMINGASRRPPVPLRVQHDRRARAGSCSTAWSSTTSQTGARAALRVRRRRLRQRDADGAARRRHRRGRRLPGHVRHRHERATAPSAWSSTPPTSPPARSPGCASRSASAAARTPAGRRQRRCGVSR